MPVVLASGQDGTTPIGAFAFQVSFGSELVPFAGLDGALTGGFSEVTGLEATMEPKVHREGGRNYGPIQLPGPVAFATVVLKRGIVGSRHLWSWWSVFAGADGAVNGGWGPGGRCDVSIAMLGSDGAPVIGWRLENAMPIKFRSADLNARSTDVAVEELHLAHEGLHLLAVA